MVQTPKRNREIKPSTTTEILLVEILIELRKLNGSEEVADEGAKEAPSKTARKKSTRKKAGK